MILLLVAVFGGLGAISRFTLESFITSRWQAPIPVGTVIINVTGSLLLGLLTGWALSDDRGAVLAIVGTGFLGGYTTFSTASVEAVRLARSGRGAAAAAHALGMVVLGFAAAALGLWITGA